MSSGETFFWKNTFRQIRDGQDVAAINANRPPDDLFNNLMYLKNILDEMTAGKALILPDQTVASSAVAGNAVYLDASGVWQPAIAELVSDTNSTLFQLTIRSQVSGMIMAKGDSTTADIVIFGQFIVDQNIIDAIVEGTVTDGIYYLSPYTAGKITASKGVAPVRACIINGPDAAGDYRVIVNPDQYAQLESHGHYKFTLVDEPAGEPSCVPGKEGFLWGELEPDGPYPGIVHTVVNPDSNLVGWLPADDPAFDGLTIPVGAKFGYNIQADTELREIWPPLPIDQVYIEVDGVGEVDDLVEVNSDGIWWMDDAYGKAPWPVNLPCSAGSDSSSSSSTAYPIWPVRIDLWFTRTLHGTTQNAFFNDTALNVGIQADLTPVAVGGDIEEVYFSGNELQAYKFTSETGSSSSSSGVDSDQLKYRLAIKDFEGLSRTVKIRLEAILGGNSDMTVATIQDIIDGLALSVTVLPSAVLTGPSDISGATTSSIIWAPEITDTSAVPADQYFKIRSAQIELNAGEMLYITLEWIKSVLTHANDEVYLYALRPVVEFE